MKKPKTVNDYFTTDRMYKLLENSEPALYKDINKGIHEIYTSCNMSIGASYETSEDESVFIVNIFVNKEYMNIAGKYRNLSDAAEILTNTWNDYYDKYYDSQKGNE